MHRAKVVALETKIAEYANENGLKLVRGFFGRLLALDENFYHQFAIHHGFHEQIKWYWYYYASQP